MKNKTIVKCFSGAAGAFLLFGFVLPFLFSSDSDIGVIAGGLITLGAALAGAISVNNHVNNVKGTKK